MTVDEAMPASLSGRRCLVVGGARGIGAAVVERLVAGGASCHVSSRDPGGPATTARDTAVSWSRGDVSRPGDVLQIVAEAATVLGGLDVLVYCAAVAAVGPFDQLTAQDWSTVFDVNVRGFALAAKAALPHLRTSMAGSVVVLSSQAARRGQALISAYTATKAATEGLVRALAIELAPQVRVNAVAPGIVLTEMIAEDFRRQASLANISDESVRAATMRRIPLGRFQPAAAVADAVAFLASPAAAEITGQVLAVDGGMTA